jgi:hypothetical protein
MKRWSSEATSDALDVLMFGGLMVFLLLLPFHLVIKETLPGPLGTYWKEVVLGLLVLLWCVRCLLARRLLLTRTALDFAVALYLGFLVLRFVLDGASWMGAWGLYMSAMYLPLFWLVAVVLRRRPARLVPLLASLVAVGAIVALGGLTEFVWNVPLWPSAELIQRQGFPGVFIYGTNIRRVYFTLDSPTTLANMLALLLPLALVLVLGAQRTLTRLAAALAAGLMAACLVVTFSRGIWLATIVSLLAMGAWLVLSTGSSRGFLRRHGRVLLVVGGGVAVIAVVWAAAWFVWRPWEQSTYQGVLELSEDAYRRAPVTGVARDLMVVEPAIGEVVTKTWTLVDPISSRVDTRPVLYEHPAADGRTEIVYTVDVPAGGALSAAIALDPAVWSPDKGDGVTFAIYAAEAGGAAKSELLLKRYINPKQNPSDRRWRNFLVDLSPWAGRTVHLGLMVDAGPAGDWGFDWAGWAEPQIVALPPNYMSSMDTEDPIVRHTSSFLDWTQDETNRDRLAAWSLAYSAWRSAPLWGTGLGSTGAAALRTDPGQAFVTESQVLKALVELGPLGLLILLFLWFQIGRVGYQTLRAMPDPAQRVLLVGVLTGLLIVFIEGVVYQNLEVKQVNAYYWTLAAIVAFLARRTAERSLAVEVQAGLPPDEPQPPGDMAGHEVE